MASLSLESKESQPTLNFLFVDDNKIVRRTIEQSFKVARANVDIRLCASLDSANERLKQGERFDMIWVDFRLSNNGEINGADWIDEVADRYPNSLFVIYTSYGGDPNIVKRIDPLYQKHTNFELFIEEKGSHDKLMQIYQSFVEQFQGVPPAFYKLIERLDRKIESSKNQQYFLEGEAYYQYQLGLNELRQQIAGQLENFESELLKRQYERLSRSWYDLLKEYHPSSPDVVNIWIRVNYFHFFNDPEMRPYLDKVAISAFRCLQSVLNLYKPSDSDPEKVKSQKLEQQKTELEFFKTLIKTLPDGKNLEWTRLKSYLKLRKEDRQQQLNPTIVYELTDKKEHLFSSVFSDWQQHKSVKRVEKLLNPSQKLLEPETETENLSQIMEIISERIEPKLIPDPKWSKKASGFWVLGGLEVISILPENCAVLFCDSLIPSSILKALWSKYSTPSLDTLSSTIPDHNFSALLESLVLGRNDSTPSFTKNPLLIIGYKDFLDKIEYIVTRWSAGSFVVENPLLCWQELLSNGCLYIWEVSI